MIRDHFPRRRQKVPWSTLLLMIILFLLLIWMKFDYGRRGSFYQFFSGGGESGRRAAYRPLDSLRLRQLQLAMDSTRAAGSAAAPAVIDSGAKAAAGKLPGRHGAMVRNPDGTWSPAGRVDSAAAKAAGGPEKGRHGVLIQNPDGTWSFVEDKDSADAATAGRPGARRSGTLIQNPDGSWSFVEDKDAADSAAGGPDARRTVALGRNPDGSWSFPGDSIPPAGKTAALSRKANPPVVEAYPGGGLYGRQVDVKLGANQACTVYYSFNDSLHPQVYRDPFRISRDTLLYFWGVDSAGNRSPAKKRWYEIGDSVSNPCPPNMVLIYREDIKFCIDRFEWPNREGKKPQGFFSFYQARDSCRLAGKYLCPAAQWQTACNTFNRYRYPYGNDYEITTCNTAGADIAASGTLPGCRTYFGVFDMSGNLREWVDTPAPQNRRFFQVRGGAWESHHNSACGDFQYSYYPENRYTSIGFRCCQKAP